MKSEGDIKKVNELMYEGKFISNVKPFKDKVRTFCQNYYLMEMLLYKDLGIY